MDCNAGSQELKVKVKLCWEFAEDFPEKEDTYKTAAIRNIMLVWNRCGSFRCTAGRHNGKNAVPVFEIVEEANETAAHEIGHCLGLPDEYCNSSLESDAAWRVLIGRANAGPAPVRDRDNGIAIKHTGCIMHNGIIVEKRHLVTLWDALTRNAGGTWTIA